MLPSPHPQALTSTSVHKEDVDAGSRNLLLGPHGKAWTFLPRDRADAFAQAERFAELLGPLTLVVPAMCSKACAKKVSMATQRSRQKSGFASANCAAASPSIPLELVR